MPVSGSITPKCDSANHYPNDPVSGWKVGDRVTPNPDRAWVHDGTEFQEIMNKPRLGTVISVPPATRDAGIGTLLVRWESLTRQPLKRAEYWTHSSLVVRAGA